MVPRILRESLVRVLRQEAEPGSFMDHVNLILVGDGPFALIDSGFTGGNEEAIAWLDKETGGEIEFLLLSHHHGDHIGGAEAICEEMGAIAIAHPNEMKLVAERHPHLAVRPLDDGGKIQIGPIGLCAVLTPGHSPGHLAFWWEKEKILFGGDNVLLPVTTWVGAPYGNLRDYLASLRRMRDLAPDIIYPGHGPPVRVLKGRIEALLLHREKRDKEILGILAEGIDDPPLMAERIYSDLDERQRKMGAEVIVAHLEKLVGEGKARSKGNGYVVND